MQAAAQPGLDGLPPELCKGFAAEFSALLHPLYLKVAWRGGDSVPVATKRGTRPGSSFAGLVFFALRVPKIILTLRDEMRNASHAVSHPPTWDGRKSFAPCTSASHIQVGDVVWAADVAVRRVCNRGSEVRAAVASEAGAVTDACGEHGMALAYTGTQNSCGRHSPQCRLYSGPEGSLWARRRPQGGCSVSGTHVPSEASRSRGS